MLQVQLEVGADPAEVGRARRWARSRLAGSGIGDDEPLAEILILLISELVTNAVVHTGCPAVLRMLFGGPGVRVEVADASDRAPPAGRRPETTRAGAAWSWWTAWRTAGAGSPRAPASGSGARSTARRRRPRTAPRTASGNLPNILTRTGNPACTSNEVLTVRHILITLVWSDSSRGDAKGPALTSAGRGVAAAVPRSGRACASPPPAGRTAPGPATGPRSGCLAGRCPGTVERERLVGGSGSVGRECRCQPVLSSPDGRLAGRISSVSSPPMAASRSCRASSRRRA